MASGWQHTGAFVVQFPPGTDLETGQFEGRVEHVASGRTMHFHSPDQLLAFIDRVLKDARTIHDHDSRDEYEQ